MATTPLFALAYDRVFVADSLRQVWPQRRGLSVMIYLICPTEAETIS